MQIRSGNKASPLTKLRYNFDNSLSRPGAFTGYVFIAIILLALAMTLVQAAIGAISALNQPLDSGTNLFVFWDAFTKILGFGSTDPWGCPNHQGALLGNWNCDLWCGHRLYFKHDHADSRSIEVG